MSTDNKIETGQKPPVTAQAKEKASELAQKTKSAAEGAAKDAASAAARRAGDAKASAANEVSGVASALRTAASEMRSGSPQERTIGQIAGGLADASDALREKDLGEMAQDLSAFARKNPLVFLGGAALIGFAASRFAKASRSQPTERVATPYNPRMGDYS